MNKKEKKWKEAILNVKRQCKILGCHRHHAKGSLLCSKHDIRITPMPHKQNNFGGGVDVYLKQTSLAGR